MRLKPSGAYLRIGLSVFAVGFVLWAGVPSALDLANALMLVSSFPLTLSVMSKQAERREERKEPSA